MPRTASRQVRVSPPRRPTAREIHPKTTRPEAELRRPPDLEQTTARQIGRTLDAMPDRVDIRDWLYRPNLSPLPNAIVNCSDVPEILDQGSEGACTGFALAAVIHFDQRRRRIPYRAVSPRMLYEMARRYDEWPGENYEGSSARGAMKGWVAHGVCRRDTWPDRIKKGPGYFSPEIADEARDVPGGAYFRVQHQQIRDMHAALADVGILYITLMVHAGWDDPRSERRRLNRHWTLPTIQRQGRATDGHAVALVGYTRDGFIVQNSWGPKWGADGFAILPYEDFLLHSTDVWVAQVGVPVGIDLWATDQGADTNAGRQRAAAAIPLADIRPFTIDVGNNGTLSDSGVYWTTEDDLGRLFSETIPEATRTWKKRRVMFYLHGGLNSEMQVAARVIAFRDVCLANEIYPVHLMWETGEKETLRDILEDYITDTDRAGGWLDNFRENLTEAKDRTFELTVSKPGTAMWNEMKENGRLASERTDERGAMQLIIANALKVLGRISAAERRSWELHVVAHSAGSIFAAYAIEQLVRLGVSFTSLSLMAPAITVQLFRDRMLPSINAGRCPHPTLYILSDDGERDDNVGPYGKSLLYLVSNSLEGRRETPLLGMQRFVQQLPGAGQPAPDTAVRQLFEQRVNNRPSLVIAGADQGPTSECRSDSHGGFDNDEWTLNSILTRILDQRPARPFTTRDLQY